VIEEGIKFSFLTPREWREFFLMPISQRIGMEKLKINEP